MKLAKARAQNRRVRFVLSGEPNPCTLSVSQTIRRGVRNSSHKYGVKNIVPFHFVVAFEECLDAKTPKIFDTSIYTRHIRDAHASLALPMMSQLCQGGLTAKISLNSSCRHSALPIRCYQRPSGTPRGDHSPFHAIHALHQRSAKTLAECTPCSVAFVACSYDTAFENVAIIIGRIDQLLQTLGANGPVRCTSGSG